MNANLKDKLKTLPMSPGVYMHLSENGDVIYVGKAAVLKNRVRQYFQNSRGMDSKTIALVKEISMTNWIETESEIDALFLESELVKRYMPKYNVLLRDDKSQLYVRIDMKSEWPTVSFTRAPIDDQADYYGPYFNGFALRKALRHLRKIFPYYTKTPKTGSRADLDTHIGLNPSDKTTSKEYKTSLRKLIKYIKGGRKDIVLSLTKDMQQSAKDHEFEKAAHLRNQLFNLKQLQQKIMYGDREMISVSSDQALNDLAKLLKLKKYPVHIEGFDISHMGGTNVVASMVVFKNGVSDRASYRKFKTRIEQNNDFFNMNETILRRFSEKIVKSWGLPDLVLIDGGKGQLDAAISALNERGIQIPVIGLAKKNEEIIVQNEWTSIELDTDYLKELGGDYIRSVTYANVALNHSSHVIKLLQRVRDESHRFAVSYHTVLKRSRQTKSALSDINGVGEASKRKLLKAFGSVQGIKSASESDIGLIVGNYRADKIKKFL